jgi:hypothetical protein
MEHDLRKWAITLRATLPDIATLLESAAAKIEIGQKDASIAADLIISAMQREHLPGLHRVTALMRRAADQLADTAEQ